MLEQLAPGKAARRARQGPRRDAARARPRPARRACSPRATRASSASSARSPRSTADSTSTPRRRRSRSRSRGSASRGTTRSSSPPTAATRTPAINTALRHPKVAILTQPGNAELIVDALAHRRPVRRRSARHAGRAPGHRAAVQRAERRDRARAHGRARDGLAAAHADPLGAARRRLRAPRGDDHQGRGPRARARRARPRDRRPHLGRRLRQRRGRDRVRAASAPPSSRSTRTPTRSPSRRATRPRTACRWPPCSAPRPSRCRISASPTPSSSAAAALPRSSTRPRDARRAVVVTLALIDRDRADDRAPRRNEFDVTATTLQANRVKPLAGGHRLAAENPVTVIVGRRAMNLGRRGVGCSLGCPPEELRALIEATLPRRRARRARDRRSPRARSRACSPRPSTSASRCARTPPRRSRRSTCRRRQRRRRAPRRHAERRRGRGAALRHAPARAQDPFRTRNLRGGRMPRVIHPIEVESYRILRVAHRPQPPPAALARGGRAGDPRRRRPVVRREPRPGRSGAGAGPRSAAQRRAGVLRRAHGRRRHHLAQADRPARRPARQDARPGPDPLRGRDAAGHRRRRRPARSG